MFTIRLFEPGDYPAIVAIRNSIQPYPITVEQLQSWDRSTLAHPTSVFVRHVAEQPGLGVVGYCIAERQPDMPAGTWFLSVNIHREYRGRGIGTKLLEIAEKICLEGGAEVLESYCRGEDDTSFEWARDHGYALDRQRTESVLDLAAFDRSRFAGRVDAMRADGFEFRTYQSPLPEAMLPEVYEWERVTAPDVPIFEGNFPTFEHWSRMVADNPTPAFHVYAYHDGLLAGGSVLEFPMDPAIKQAHTGYTAVRREYRGRGLALALKLITIDEAIRRGYATMRTNNDPDNPSMLAVNTKLGYLLVPGPRRLKKPVAR